MMASARCGAKTWHGAPCRSPAVRGKCRCRMHCGAKSSGAPRDNLNALTHGLYTSEAPARRNRKASSRHGSIAACEPAKSRVRVILVHTSRHGEPPSPAVSRSKDRLRPLLSGLNVLVSLELRQTAHLRRICCVETEKSKLGFADVALILPQTQMSSRT